MAQLERPASAGFQTFRHNNAVFLFIESGVSAKENINLFSTTRLMS
jgi:hypothetical protein